jgi:hypothetical protein
MALVFITLYFIRSHSLKIPFDVRGLFNSCNTYFHGRRDKDPTKEDPNLIINSLSDNTLDEAQNAVLSEDTLPTANYEFMKDLPLIREKTEEVQTQESDEVCHDPNESLIQVTIPLCTSNQNNPEPKPCLSVQETLLILKTIREDTSNAQK